MEIIITSGHGAGKTLLSAFDTALMSAGVHNYNLLVLSSIIPPGTVVKQRKFKTPDSEYGRRLYVVMSENRSREAGKWIGASLGWYQLADGRGMFVEHRMTEETEEAVKSNLKSEITHSLADMCRNRNIPFKPNLVQMKMSITQVKNPSSVLVIAVYQSEPW